MAVDHPTRSKNIFGNIESRDVNLPTSNDMAPYLQGLVYAEESLWRQLLDDKGAVVNPNNPTDLLDIGTIDPNGDFVPATQNEIFEATTVLHKRWLRRLHGNLLTFEQRRTQPIIQADVGGGVKDSVQRIDSESEAKNEQNLGTDDDPEVGEQAKL